MSMHYYHDCQSCYMIGLGFAVNDDGCLRKKGFADKDYTLTYAAAFSSSFCSSSLRLGSSPAFSVGGCQCRLSPLAANVLLYAPLPNSGLKLLGSFRSIIDTFVLGAAANGSSPSS